MTFPTDPGAELAAIAHVIENAGSGANLLTADLFASNDGIVLADALRGLVEERSAVSGITVGRRCSMELVTKALAAAGPDLGYFVPILREKRALRALLATAGSLNAKVCEFDGAKGAIATDLRAAIAEVSTELMATARGLDDGKRRGMAENLGDIVSALEAADRGEKPPTVTTGLPAIDRVLGGGLRNREMTTAAARTSGGKSALAQGQIEGTCVGTTYASDQIYYYNRPQSVKALHGYGTTMLAGVEMIRMLKNPAFTIDYKLRTYHYVPKDGGATSYREHN